MFEYRPFHNRDVPKLVELWNFSQLGPGAALDITNDIFDSLVLAEPYFEKSGLIVAHEGKEILGYTQAGFGPNAAGTELNTDVGIISAVIVRTDYRRRGIGRELVARAEQYLREKGAKEILFGEAERRAPFYLGLYGSSECAGILESDPTAGLFLQALGWQPAERFLLLSRNITAKKDPFDPRLIAIKRQMKFGIMDKPPGASWWWMTRHGRFESLSFALVPNSGAAPPAFVSCWGMELHSACRGQRTVGLTDLVTIDSDRRKGYAKALVLEVLRRLREDQVTHVEMVVPADNTPAVNLFRALGFEVFDTGSVYRKR